MDISGAIGRLAATNAKFLRFLRGVQRGEQIEFSQ
jgi:hypothetical protein